MSRYTHVIFDFGGVITASPFEAFNRLEEACHAALEEINVLVVKRQAFDVCREGADRAAHIHETAHHADTGTFAKHGIKFFAVIAADDRPAAAHEFKTERACIFQSPKFRRAKFWIVFHQRT